MWTCDGKGKLGNGIGTDGTMNERSVIRAYAQCLMARGCHLYIWKAWALTRAWSGVCIDTRCSLQSVMLRKLPQMARTTVSRCQSTQICCKRLSIFHQSTNDLSFYPRSDLCTSTYASVVFLDRLFRMQKRSSRFCARIYQYFLLDALSL